MILAGFQFGRTPNVMLSIAIVCPVGLCAIVVPILFLVQRLFRNGMPMVYHLKGHDLAITFVHLDQDEPEVVVALGAETRTFQLEGFINFWSDMVKVGRQAMAARLELTGSVDSVREDRAPELYYLKRGDL